MTIEKKAEAYDKAIEKAKSWYVDAQINFKKSLETLFPELKESEGEIPQKLHNLLCAEVTYEQFEKHNLTVDSALDWLEKQTNMLSSESANKI